MVYISVYFSLFYLFIFYSSFCLFFTLIFIYFLLYMKIARAILLKIPLEMCQFTRMPMTLKLVVDVVEFFSVKRIYNIYLFIY